MSNEVALYIVLMLLCAIPGQAQSSRSVCDLAKAPEHYNGKIVTISGLLSVTMHSTTVQDPRCRFSVLIEGSGADKTKDAKGESVGRLWSMLPKLRERQYDPNYSSHKPQVTVTGLFETTYRLQNGNRVAVGHGFGDHGLFHNRLILKRVDKFPEPADPNTENQHLTNHADNDHKARH